MRNWGSFALAVCAGFTLATGVAATEERGSYSGAVETVYPDWFKESFLEFEDDVRDAAEEDKRLVLFFHQDGCPYCNLLVERNLAQKDIEEKMRKAFDVVALNMWGDREVVTVSGEAFTEKEFAAAIGVKYTPTLLFLDEQGQLALRLDGYYPPQNFSVALDYVAERKEKSTSYPNYYASRKPADTTGELNQEPFFSSPPHNLMRNGETSSPPLAVFFEQRQCPNCDSLHQVTLKDASTRALVEQFESVQLDMWSDAPVITPSRERTNARDWARALGITYAPSIVFFDRQGREVMRTDAYLKSFHVQSIMDYVLSGAYETQPSFQRFISERADHLMEQGIDVDLWQ